MDGEGSRLLSLGASLEALPLGRMGGSTREGIFSI